MVGGGRMNIGEHRSLVQEESPFIGRVARPGLPSAIPPASLQVNMHACIQCIARLRNAAIRNTWSKEGDGLGCSVDSYHNLTSYLDVVSMANQT